MSTIAVIGTGIGGLYVLPGLARAGCKVRLHDINESKLADIRARGGVDVEGDEGAFASIELATTDLRAAVEGAEIIIVCSGGNTHGAVAAALAPLIVDGQLILLIQGNTGGSLIFRAALARSSCRANVDVAEMDNFPYAFR